MSKECIQVVGIFKSTLLLSIESTRILKPMIVSALIECSGGSRIFERGFQFLLDNKKKVINLHTSLSVVFYIYYWMISNKTTVIGASQSNCSIRESRSDCSIRVYEFQKGVYVETLKPPGSATGMTYH